MGLAHRTSSARGHPPHPTVFSHHDQALAPQHSAPEADRDALTQHRGRRLHRAAAGKRRPPEPRRPTCLALIHPALRQDIFSPQPFCSTIAIGISLSRRTLCSTLPHSEPPPQVAARRVLLVKLLCLLFLQLRWALLRHQSSVTEERVNAVCCCHQGRQDPHRRWVTPAVPGSICRHRELPTDAPLLIGPSNRALAHQPTRSPASPSALTVLLWVAFYGELPSTETPKPLPLTAGVLPDLFPDSPHC
jgi:hypothetical protein